MPPKIDWDSQLGRRMRLRDLHVFTTSVRLGSMAKAAKELGVSQPAVSEVIAGLEHTLGVKLLDRTPHGVEPTAYVSALLRRSIAAFDELRQGVRDIEFLSDPTVGELRIGCPESIAAAYLQPIIALFTETHPHVVLDIDTVNTLSFSPKLRERTLDLVLARAGWPLDEPSLVEDLTIEPLFDDHLVVAVGESHPLARRRRPKWADLADQRWVLTGSDSWNYRLIAEAFIRVQFVGVAAVRDKTIPLLIICRHTEKPNCLIPDREKPMTQDKSIAYRMLETRTASGGVKFWLANAGHAKDAAFINGMLLAEKDRLPFGFLAKAATGDGVMKTKTFLLPDGQCELHIDL